MKPNKSLLFICLFVFCSYTFKDIDLKEYWVNLISQSNLKLKEQSYCFKIDGIIDGENIDQKIKPASVTKLYTTLWSLEKLTKNHQFQTQFKVIGNDLFITGGEDPYFVTENLFLIMNKLTQLGVSKIDTVYFSRDFFINWSDSSISVANNILKIMNTKTWPKAIKETYAETQNFIRRNDLDINFNINSFEVHQVKLLDEQSPEVYDYSFIHKSSPLWMHLKQVNMYSNNFYTDHIFNFLGGEKEFSKYINKKLSVTSDVIHFSTGSGLGDNYTTCRTTLLMLDSLRGIIQSEGLKPEDIIAVPGVDDGTLKYRFTENGYTRKLVAKTGTLNDTSTLAGYLFSQNKLEFFGVFNHTAPHSDKTAVRALQNDFIKKSIDLIGSSYEIQYQSPDYNPILKVQIIE